MYSRVSKIIFESNYCQKWQHLDNSSSNVDAKFAKMAKNLEQKLTILATEHSSNGLA